MVTIRYYSSYVLVATNFIFKIVQFLKTVKLLNKVTANLKTINFT